MGVEVVDLFGCPVELVDEDVDMEILGEGAKEEVEVVVDRDD